MSYYGDIRLGDTIDIKFTTFDASGAPITLAGSPVVSAYPGNSTTELTAGITLSVDFDGRTGLHNLRIVATSGNGYAAGTNYALVITTGTIDTVNAVGTVVAAFSIQARVADVAAISGDSAAADNLEAMLDGTGGVKLTLEQLRIDSTSAGGAVDIDNSAGPGLSAVSSGASANGIEGQGNGTGHGLAATGGTDGNGIAAIGTGAGNGINAFSNGASAGIRAGSSGGVGLAAVAGGTSAGFRPRGAGGGLDIDAAQLPAALTAGGHMKADALAINGSLPAAALQSYAALGIVSALAIAGTLSATAMTTDLTEATNDHYKDRALVFLTGVLAGAAVRISAYTGATKLLTYSATPTGEAPSAGDRFILV
jgi:hypothetical protein